MTTTISIISQKGGAGKTTVALALLGAALEDGKTVWPVDVDPQAALVSWNTARKRSGRPDADVRTTLPTVSGRGPDLVLIDTPPQSSDQVLEVVRASDVVLVVAKPSTMDLRAI